MRGRLAFENKDNRLIVLPAGRSVTVKTPGGLNSFSGFARTQERFFKGPMLLEAIDRSGVKRSMSNAARRSTSVPKVISSKLTFTAISPSSVKRLAKLKAESEGVRL